MRNLILKFYIEKNNLKLDLKHNDVKNIFSKYKEFIIKVK